MTQLSKEEIQNLQKEGEGKSALEVIQWSLDHFGLENVALSSSLGVEDQVLTHLLSECNPQAQVFTLDTGRLHQETYDVLAETMSKYSLQFDVLFPESTDVEKMHREFGPNLFYDSVENRKLCCQIRKIAPLKRKLGTLKAWICGLRREQSSNRADVQLIEWDEGNQMVKINPLAAWTEEDVWKYIKDNKIPYNQLHDQNFPSIGCAPCTRAIQLGDDHRAGRWWWEQDSKKECGLHWVDGKLVRAGGN